MRARLHTPELLTILPVDRAATEVDTLAAEPYSRLERGATVTIKAQVDESERGKRLPGQGGATMPDRSILTFLRRDCDRLGYEPTKGDRVIAIADGDGSHSRTVNWYIAERHYTGKDGRRSKLIQASAENGPPSRTPTEVL